MDIVARLKADPLTDPAHTSQLIVEAVREIERLRSLIVEHETIMGPNTEITFPEITG